MLLQLTSFHHISKLLSTESSSHQKATRKKHDLHGMKEKLPPLSYWEIRWGKTTCHAITFPLNKHSFSFKHFRFLFFSSLEHHRNFFLSYDKFNLFVQWTIFAFKAVYMELWRKKKLYCHTAATAYGVRNESSSSEPSPNLRSPSEASSLSDKLSQSSSLSAAFGILFRHRLSPSIK